MLRKLFAAVAAALLTVCMICSVSAETLYGSSEWKISFTDEDKLESNFKTADLDEVVYGMQPGDRVILTMSLENKNDTAADWYMTNEVLYSLEDRSSDSSTGGGAYTYILTYTDKDGTEKTLFSSDTVGGDNINPDGEGLKGATSALKDYFYLDTMSTGQSGTVRLEVALDGETQGNSYQDTLADLQMNFAVSPGGNASGTSEPNVPTEIIKTGDETDISPFVLTACITGSLLLIIAFIGKREDKQSGRKEVRR